MIRRLLFLFGLIFCAHYAHATNCALTSGANQSAIQTAITAAGSSSCTGTSSATTVGFAFGTYGPITSTMLLPCGVNLIGPTVPYSQTPNYTALINGSSSFNNANGFQTTSGCSASQTIQYLEWNGQHANTNTNGGGFIQINAGTTNLSILNNYLHGADTVGQSRSGCCSSSSIQVFFAGTSTTTSNVTVRWNQIGGTSYGDCNGAFTSPGGNNNEQNNGSNCNSIGIQNNVSNITITNNNFSYVEEDIKVYESNTPSCNNVVINNNSFNQVYRIYLETQCYTGNNALMYIQYNNTIGKWGTSATSNIWTDGWSIANGCVNALSATCLTHNDYNNLLEINNAVPGNTGNEFWGTSASSPATNYATSSTTTYNLYQGYWQNGIIWSPSGSMILNNNTFNIVNGGSTSCGSVGSWPGGGYWNVNNNPSSGGVPVYSPTCTGNSFSTAITGTYPSAAPSLPPSQSFTGSFAVPITNIGTSSVASTSGPNSGINNTDWCTTDGSTPVVGGSAVSGGNTAKPYWTGVTPGLAPTSNVAGTITVTSTTTVKCIGMWGAPNQPYSYPSNYSYVPSSVVSATYTGSSTSPAATPTFSPASETFNGTLSVTASSSTPSSTLYCTTNGTTPTTGSPVYSGPFSVTTTTQIQCIAVASGFSQSSVGSATYTQATTATPVLTPASSSSFYPTQSVTIADSTSGSTIYYTLDGSTPTTSSNVYSSALTLNATTTVKAISAASGYQNSAIASGTYTYTTPTLTGATSTNSGAVTSIAIGGTLNQIGQCGYNVGPTYACNSTDANGGKIISWASSNTAVFTVSSAGLVTGIGTGTANVNCQAQQGSSAPVTCTPYSITVVNTPPTLTGVTIALQVPPGGSTVTISSPVQACGTNYYTGGITTTQCGNSADAYGTTLGTWTSSAPSKGTISTSGLVTGVANGTTNISVTATNGATTFTASPVTITINTAVVGANVTCTGCYNSGGVYVQ